MCCSALLTRTHATVALLENRVCGSVVWCVAACCGVLRCATVCCGALPFSIKLMQLWPRPTTRGVAVRYGLLQRVSGCCGAVQCVTVQCSVLPCVALCYSEFLYQTHASAALPENKQCCSALQHVEVCCGVL